MNHIVIGIFAHVDAGKTTLSEGLLYCSGLLQQMGRVDKRNAFLDTFQLEKQRGITIFSKQAVFTMKDKMVTLIDTPGHVDFSAEMERTLQIMDYAILVISKTDGVKSHTKTLWKLLKQYEIPVFVFINKMDLPGIEPKDILQNLEKELGGNFIDFINIDKREIMEQIAMCSDELMELYLENEKIETEDIRGAVLQRNIIPCYFGSALKMEGVKEFYHGLSTYCCSFSYPEEFGARVYKITRDDLGNRLTHMKITGGKLKVKDTISNGDKVNQIRIYSGSKYKTADEVNAGEICAVTGLTDSHAGQGIGADNMPWMPMLLPVLNYELILPEENKNMGEILFFFHQLEEEIPEINIKWDEHLGKIQCQVMGDIQKEVIHDIIQERFHMEVSFGKQTIQYKETIKNTIEGVGHFEPLRHYAEVHVIIEPGDQGSGITYDSICGEDELDRNWQRLILTHIEEKEHVGVLTGSPLTDVHIVLAAGRAHVKHTEGGDFRQATYRAVRQGLRKAESVLLEPWYHFDIELPREYLGHAMADIDKMSGYFTLNESGSDTALITGEVPVESLGEYKRELLSYTKGEGRIQLELSGYAPCHNAKEVITELSYNPDSDVDNPCSSVFCAHGAGFIVPWDEVEKHMQVESVLKSVKEEGKNTERGEYKLTEGAFISVEEIDEILNRTTSGNRKDSKKKNTVNLSRKQMIHYGEPQKSTKVKKLDKYLLVDGYNIIFAWKELKDLAEDNIDGARGRLLDIMCNYQATQDFSVIVVFDAYRCKNHSREYVNYHNIHVVYTKEAETADAFIERFAHENMTKYHVTVATSDGLEQIIIRGAGAYLMSAKELEDSVLEHNRKLMQEYRDHNKKNRYLLSEQIPDE